MSTSSNCVDYTSSDIKRYSDLYLCKENKEEVNTFDPIQYLYEQNDKLNRPDILACYSEPNCICISSDTCDCDHDDFVEVRNVNFDCESNCIMSLKFDLNKPLNPYASSKDNIGCPKDISKSQWKKMKNELKQSQEEHEQLNVKMFYVDAKQEEHLICTLSREQNKIIFVTGMSFSLDDIFDTCQSQLIMRLNYMNYSKCYQTS